MQSIAIPGAYIQMTGTRTEATPAGVVQENLNPPSISMWLIVPK